MARSRNDLRIHHSRHRRLSDDSHPKLDRTDAAAGLAFDRLVHDLASGRAAMATSMLIGPALAAVIDLSFLALLLAVVLREIVSGRNWRNLPMPGALAVLLLANVLMHTGAADVALSEAAGQRLGIATITLLISLIGGRIIPSFTRNWLAKRGETQMPSSVGWVDYVSLALTFAALGAWVGAPESQHSGVVLVAAGLASAIRLARWCGHRTLSEPLVWSLHLGFAWIPIGLCLLGLGTLLPAFVPSTAGLHALTAGAIGSMTLAVMTRATSRTHPGGRWPPISGLQRSTFPSPRRRALRVAAPMFLDVYGLSALGSRPSMERRVWPLHPSFQRASSLQYTSHELKRPCVRRDDRQHSVLVSVPGAETPLVASISAVGSLASQEDGNNVQASGSVQERSHYPTCFPIQLSRRS